MKIHCLIINGQILMKFCTWVSHDNNILQRIPKSLLKSDNEIIMLKFEHLSKALRFERLDLSSLWMKQLAKIGQN